MLIDTHAHLNFPEYEKEEEKIISRAIKAGVKKIICVSSNIGDSQKAITIARKYLGVVFAAVGIHPQQTAPENQDSPEKQLEKLETLASQKEVVAIGECGLDFSLAPPGEKERPRDVQQTLFKGQIKIAQKLNLPILVHSRESFLQTIEILEKFKNLRGIFHCYSGGKKGIKKVQDLGFLFGVAGNLTYDEGLKNVFRQIPLEKIVLETDCPFLAPLPFRGQRNEPSYLKYTAKTLAEIKNISYEKVAKITTKTAQSLFKI
jgi:TatD DNase family protein